MLAQQSLRDQELLRLLEHFVLLVPELLCLFDERREHERRDEAQRAEDREIQDEDGEPAREAAGADRQDLLPFDQPDDRAEPDGEQAADVEEQQHVADQERRPQQDDGKRGHPEGPEDQRLVTVRIGAVFGMLEVSGRRGQGVGSRPSGVRAAQELGGELRHEIVDVGELRG